ncbi:Os12g0542500 [Oryza sativa Japonica Group]|uniref:Os12g0542500 protein n=2 Tax=Oryza sativa subsp. japonica TaxID=39947 RepID=A0A0P0YBR6_ORYSJ|nr:Os12g0542500 [Oryza sativa Japonica Group]
MLYMQHEGMSTPCSCIICGVGEKDCDLAPFTPVGSRGPPPGGLPPTPGGVHLRRKGPYRRPRKPTEVRSQAKCPGDLRAQSRALKATELAQGPRRIRSWLKGLQSSYQEFGAGA